MQPPSTNTCVWDGTHSTLGCKCLQKYLRVPQKQKRHPHRDGASLLDFSRETAYCSRFQLIISPSVVVELETGAL